MRLPTNDHIAKSFVGIFADGGGAFYFSEEDLVPSQFADSLSQDSATGHQTLRGKPSRPLRLPVSSFTAIIRWPIGTRKSIRHPSLLDVFLQYFVQRAVIDGECARQRASAHRVSSRQAIG